MVDPSDPLVDRVLDGRYHVLRVIGQGAMGTVYVARQLSTGIDRALKVVRAEHQDDPGRIRRFEREAEVIKRLRDPNTVQLVDQGRTAEGRLYLVSQLLEGETLGARLRRGPLTVHQTLEVMAAVGNALREAHALGIVHRDLKPENIFVAALGHREVIKVLDFGVARLAGASSTTGGVIGTAAYMAPEQALAQSVDGRADLYSVGVVAYECLAGQRPFTERNPAVVLHQHAFIDPPPLGPRVPHVPAPVAQLVMVLLRKAPDERLADAASLCAAVRSLTHDPHTSVVSTLDLGTTATLDAVAPHRPEPPGPSAPPLRWPGGSMASASTVDPSMGPGSGSVRSPEEVSAQPSVSDADGISDIAADSASAVDSAAVDSVSGPAVVSVDGPEVEPPVSPATTLPGSVEPRRRWMAGVLSVVVALALVAAWWGGADDRDGAPPADAGVTPRSAAVDAAIDAATGAPVGPDGGMAAFSDAANDAGSADTALDAAVSPSDAGLPVDAALRPKRPARSRRRPRTRPVVVPRDASPPTVVDMARPAPAPPVPDAAPPAKPSPTAGFVLDLGL